MAEGAGGTPSSGGAAGSRREESLSAKGAVVAALDGSGADDPVVDLAADAAADLGAPLRLVTVLDAHTQLTPFEAVPGGSTSVAGHLDHSAHHTLELGVERTRARRDDVRDIATAVPWGTPAAALVRLSEDAARIVVGAPARGRLGRILLGSVAIPVVAHAHCPVVVVPADTVVAPPRRILVGVDGSEASARAVELGLTMAESSGARVTCVLGWNLEVLDGAVVTEPSSEHWATVETRFTTLGHGTVDPVSARHPEVGVDIVVRHGSPARAIVETAAEMDVDLVVVGSRGLGGFAAFSSARSAVMSSSARGAWSSSCTEVHGAGLGSTRVRHPISRRAGSGDGLATQGPSTMSATNPSSVRGDHATWDLALLIHTSHPFAAERGRG
jgi:nucleotide-binding universal stress UspA family protein